MKPVAAVFSALVLAVGHGSAASAQDAAHGKQLFLTCAYCHGPIGAGGPVGPTLKDIVGKPAAASPGFPYSEAMKSSGVTWTEDQLAAFLLKPEAVVKGTRMAFPGVPAETDARDLVAYLKSLN